MQTVIFSDTHLSSRVYRKKFNYLKSIIEPADRVIILGDFWDGFLTSFDKFLNSQWNQLFPLLLEREAAYVYGNHDRLQWSDERVDLFSVEHGMELHRNFGPYELYLTHGHTVFTSLEDKYPALNHSIPLRMGASLDVLHKLVWGRRFMRDDNKINNPGRNWVNQSLPAPQILVCGHSHYPELDLTQRMINTGFIGTGYGNYLRIIDDDIQLVREKY